MYRIILFIFLSNFVFSQNVLVQGIVKDSTNGKSKINIKISGEYSRTLSAQKNGTFSFYTNENDSLTFYSHRHINQSYKVKDLLKSDKIEIILEPGGCVEYIPCEDKGELLIFIGKKIKVEDGEQENFCDYINVDHKYIAEYEIIEILEGSYDKSFIEFTSYEHSGRNYNFYDYDYSIIYLKKSCGKYFHYKYQYDPLYKSIDNDFVSTYDYSLFDSLKSSYQDFNLKIKKIKTPPTFKISSISLNVENRYPKPFYKLFRKKAQANYGFTANTIYKVRLKNILQEYYEIN